MVRPDPDQELATKIAARDRRALYQFLEKYGAQVVSIIWRRIDGRGTRRDLRALFVDVGVRVWTQTPTYVRRNPKPTYAVWVTNVIHGAIDDFLDGAEED